MKSVRRPMFTAFAALALTWCSACSTTPVRVEIAPQTVKMSRVEVDGSTASKQEDSSYRGSISTPKSGPEDVEVVGVSEAGVEARRSVRVTADGENRFTLEMPGAVDVRVRSGAAKNLTVGDDVVTSREFPVRHPVQVPAGGREVTVHAVGEGGFVDETTVTVRAGEVTRVDLELELLARMRAISDTVSYGEEIEFDASTSSPSGSIGKYTWSFGDGTPDRTVTEPTIRHAFQYREGTGDPGRFPVTVKVLTESGQSAQTRQVVNVKLQNELLEVGVEAYPADARKRLAGESVQLRLLPRAGYHPKELSELTLDFGDGTSTTTDASGAPLRIEIRDDKPVPILVNHTYAAPGRFRPTLRYGHPLPGLEGPFDAKLNAGGEAFALHVSPKYLTEAELEDRAWQDVYSKLRGLLSALKREPDAQNSDSRFAITSLENADYESDPRFKSRVDRLTRLMVADGYHVMERSAPVLSRLAPESVVDISRRSGEGVSVKKPGEYQQHLDYGLVSHGGEDGKSLAFGIRVEGTDDRLISNKLDDSGSAEVAEVAEAVSTKAGISIEDATDHVKDAMITFSRRDLPVLVARFDTAHYLLAIRVAKEPEPTIEESVAYSEELSQPIDRQQIVVELDVRVLDRSGRVLAADTLRGEAAQLVDRTYLP